MLKAVVNTVTAVALAGVVVLATQSACAVSNNGPRQGSMEQTQIGVHIPWAIGGDRIERDGTRINHPGEWPDFEVDAIRLWDTRTAWLNPELWGHRYGQLKHCPDQMPLGLARVQHHHLRT